MRAVILPEFWYEEATIFMERLNSLQPLYFNIPYPASALMKLNDYTLSLGDLLNQKQAHSALIFLPKHFASGDKIDLWPSLIQGHSTGSWILAIIFADTWTEAELALLQLTDVEDNYEEMETHLTCQYQPPYTSIVKSWQNERRITYHPGDYFKEDILPAISKMRGNWVYWGHGEGDKLRGYGHLHTSELLTYRCTKPLNSTLWFTCTTLEREYPENIALAWYQSGATKCIFASTEKVDTQDNKLLSEVWLESAKNCAGKTIPELILKVLQKDPVCFQKILNQYFLIGIPWVSSQI
ncbi:hypothetical protein LV84_02595 [Algoriphagus ratkowskyi]|uniref:CHAT domain-containing protein n=1 Tax=Algoriphagus ratkowskyi TaxID=57028 RepID=A0A2W7RIT3_9BACT|nr:hypothetical protein [Algoriphagus ratkowskyi]PZX55457.1 hypothetical protein LV84_02595 [Algoriphagus ratkowskyi]TXD79625.1 hypothetical protein ESW18_00385 [Algoriphagus ratkowskyi]